MVSFDNAARYTLSPPSNGGTLPNLMSLRGLPPCVRERIPACLPAAVSFVLLRSYILAQEIGPKGLRCRRRRCRHTRRCRPRPPRLSCLKGRPCGNRAPRSLPTTRASHPPNFPFWLHGAKLPANTKVLATGARCAPSSKTDLNCPLHDIMIYLLL